VPPAFSQFTGRQKYLIDTSVLARVLREPQIHHVVAGLVADGLAATCATIDLEVGYSARGHADLVATAEIRRTLYTVLPLTEPIAARAREVQALLAAAGRHRAAGGFDLLTAAVAEYHDAIVLHYDADFEHIATVTGQPHQWVVPRGSVD
jgi:predicted nucleic acid-binding protein